MDYIILGSVIFLAGMLALFLANQKKTGDSSRDREIQLKDQLIAFAEIGQAIQKLTAQQEEAQKLGQSLKDLLQAPKLRGTYGEVILEEMLDRVLPVGIWQRQYTIDHGAIVDCVVKYRDVVVPIDAKFPRVDYIRYMESESKDDRSIHWKAFEDAVRRQIMHISTKYVKPEKGTSDFALMFIPSEAIYYETIAENNYIGEPSRIFDFAQTHHVLPVSPNTFYAFLQIVLLSIRNVEIIANARKLQDGLLDMQKSFQFFYGKHEDLGKRLDQMSESYRIGSDHLERYKRRLDNTLQLDDWQTENTPSMQASDEQ